MRKKPVAPGRPVVVVVGLGPAGPELTTPAAREALSSATVVLVRTAQHDASAPLLAEGARALDEHYERGATFEATYAAIVEDVVAEAVAHGRVAYAVPGSPLVLERAVRQLLSDERVEVEIVAGMSFLDLVWERLRIDPVSESVRLVDAERFALDAAGDTGPMLVAHLWSRALASEMKLALETFPSTPVVLLHHLGHDDEQVVELSWSELDQSIELDHLSCLWIPELAAPVASELMALDELVHVFRERCPWDAEQTHASLARHLIEETYEAIDAIDEFAAHATSETPEAAVAIDHLEEELGDVLCQVVFHSVLASEEGLFTLADVARTTHDKLVHRHPHVFGDAVAADAGEVVERWEKLKQKEKGRESITDGIPSALPSLALAAKLERKAKSAALGWGVTGATDEEIGAQLADVLDAAASHRLAPEPLGGLLLVLTRLSSAAGVDPDDALRRSAHGFRDRLRRTEAVVAGRGAPLFETPVAERLEAWRRVADST